ncbi:DUF1993 domain-containing protein [Leptolyngbya sp. 15MV]|nr:DUF1993 domain-containing protein [Leptolyngbya sp. 15MV]
MSLTLHAALVPTWLQILGSVEGMVAKADAWCEEHGHAPVELLGARLVEDMLPFAYQVKSCWVHSALAIEGVRRGQFQPHMDPPPDSFAGLADKLAEARVTLDAVTAAELDGLADNDVVFIIGDKLRMEFTARDFLLGFSVPNFHFHAATAYGILRMKGLDVGKRDYIGKVPLKAG